jgi:hypothetical protein
MTRRFLSLFILAGAGWLATPCVWGADPTNAAPDFKEVYELLRANLPGATDGNLNRAAVDGLLSQFPGKVTLVGGATGAAGSTGATALGRSAIIENNVAYVRVSRVAESLPAELEAAGRVLTATNKVTGVVLDLRFAGGDDFAAAQEAAKVLSAPKASCPLAGPLVVLVNGGTCGAAEAMVAALRKAETVLIVGSSTAGGTMTFREFALKDGERLLVATTPVKVDGQAIPSEGLKPDIALAVNADDERAFWQDPYGVPALDNGNIKTVTNSYLPFLDRVSEADLVRQKQKDGKLINQSLTPGPARSPSHKNSDDGDVDEDSASARAGEPQKPALRDPVLARAVDLVKGLAVMRGSHP